MRFLLCTVFVLAALLVPNARGEEYDSSGENGNGDSNDGGNDGGNDEGSDIPWFKKLFDTIKKFFQDILDLFREFRAEFEAKTRGVVVWTEKMWVSMKKEMEDWIDDYDSATEEEKNKMRMFIERLKMPEESEEDYY